VEHFLGIVVVVQARDGLRRHVDEAADA